jgi:hypothetical protein
VTKIRNIDSRIGATLIQGTTRLDSTIERSQRSIDLRRLNLTLFVNGDLISPQIERLLGEVYEAGCPSRLRQAA